METPATNAGNIVMLAYEIQKGVAHVIANHVRNNFLMYYLKRSAAMSWRSSPQSSTGIWWFSMMEARGSIIANGCSFSDNLPLNYDDPKKIVFVVDTRETDSYADGDICLLYFIAWGRICPTSDLTAFIHDATREYKEALDETETSLPEDLARLNDMFQNPTTEQSQSNSVDVAVPFEYWSIIDSTMDGPIPAAFRPTILSALPDGQPENSTIINKEPPKRPGRYRLLPEEIKRRKKIVKQAEQLKRKNPQLLWKEIAANLGLPYRTLSEYLHQYGTLHR